MSEIDKLYENAGIELIEGLEWVCQNPDHCVYQNLSVTPENCIGCEHFEREMRYPPFTAEKVLKVIIFLLNKKVKLSFLTEESAKISVENFKECIAKSVNYLWQYLTEEEKQQVKGILE